MGSSSRIFLKKPSYFYANGDMPTQYIMEYQMGSSSQRFL